ncbi:dTDP-4-amino-4,6-dideoxygalactose transaminase [Gracilibacillus caseinilyticus]|uniref:dTDP-4-amino-4,6-dideoxygalactose transaminase n=1 Tax=Gracilibacillus caseinilyticus TaxID=2932256 RepID=A0ABY4F0D7_9BACI|nr:dTDP-4-amino-4,6-dideoxygalactose transaminase [Gracilibacillus caseinilyticus]UOQ49655.1 dTDP-4-amino-4,6-dideoxygalactose transaminase [Gracilibacillus caseinilyticus]
MIPFNKPCLIGTEKEAIQQVLEQDKLSGNGPFGHRCTTWFEERLGCHKAILTPSCTAALEMTALLTEVAEEDEVIIPSYTFVSTANAFALRGARIRFVDVRAETMNIDPEQIAKAITNRTKAIVIVHYAGVSCDMDAIMALAAKHNLWVIEDAAQGLMSEYKGKPLGTIGHLGTYSFHETKNYTCGEGGVLIVNDRSLVERAEILQEKGTDRSQFVKGMVDKYTWRDLGSSYLLSELNAAYLSVQLEHADRINQDRLRAWNLYQEGLTTLADNGYIDLPYIPEDCQHNAHMFYIKTKDKTQCSQLIQHLKEDGVMAVTHYIPLHSSQAGKQFGEFIGEDRYTTVHSEKLLRLPLYYGIRKEDIHHVVESIQQFYQV